MKNNYFRIPQCKVCGTPMLNIMSISEVEHICSKKCLKLRLEMINMLITEEFIRRAFLLKDNKKIQKKVKKFAKKNGYKKKLVLQVVYDRGLELGLELN